MTRILKKFLLLLILLVNTSGYIHAMTSDNYADPDPRYATIDPQEFLYRKEREWLKGLSDSPERETERVRFAISPFVQFANRGRDVNNNQEYLGDLFGRWNMIALLFGATPENQNLTTTLQAAKDVLFPNMQIVQDPGLYVDPNKQFGFFAVPLQYKKYGARFEFDIRFCKDFGVCVQTGYACIQQKQQDLCKYYDICAGVSCIGNGCKNMPLKSSELDAIASTRDSFDFNGVNAQNSQTRSPNTNYDLMAGPTTPVNQASGPTNLTSGPSTSNNAYKNMPKKDFELDAMTITKDSCSITSGASGACSHLGYTLPVDLTSCLSGPNGSTGGAVLPTFTPSVNPGVPVLQQQDVEYYLMNQLYTITQEMCLNLSDFNKNSIEDVRFNLYWRHAIEVNRNADSEDWPHFLFIPFIELCYDAATGATKNPCCVFSLPFGNDGHDAVGGKAGFLIDFTDTMEIGIEGGATHFFEKSFSNFRVPTSIYQTGIFPFATSVKICPGLNCFGTFKLAAYHFLGNLSTFWQYDIVTHTNDQICLCKPDPAFLPGVLEKRSSWTSQMLNIGFNYDISPNLGLGAFCQAPLWQKRAYASTTVMIGLNATF